MWFGAVYAEGGDGYLHNLLFNQTVNRAVDAFHHKRPFYYYFVSVWYVAAPWSLLMAGILVIAIRQKLLQTDMEQLFLTVVVVTIGMLSLISSKVDVYLLPLLPFLIYLSVLLLQKMPQSVSLRVLLAVPVALVILAVPVGLVVLHQSQPELFSVSLCLAGGFVLVLGVITLWLLLKKTALQQVGALFGGGMLVSLLFFAPLLPKANGMIGYKEMCRAGMQLAERNSLSDFYFYNIRRGENMYATGPLDNNSVVRKAGWLCAILAVIAILKILILKNYAQDLHSEEAQYWVWSRHLQLSYYSKPPMIAYLNRLSTDIFGNTVFGIRINALIAGILVSFVTFFLAYQLFKNSKTALFAAIVTCIFPFLISISVCFSTDTPLILFWLCGLLFFWKALHTDKLLWWILFGVALGLGALSKYSMKEFWEEWKIRPIDKNRSLVELEFYINPGTHLPDWIVNMVLTDSPIKVIRAMGLAVRAL